MAYKVVYNRHPHYSSAIVYHTNLVLQYKLNHETKGVYPIFVFLRLSDAEKWVRIFSSPYCFSILRCHTTGLRAIPFKRIPQTNPRDVQVFWRNSKLPGFTWAIPEGTMIADSITPTKVVREYHDHQ